MRASQILVLSIMLLVAAVLLYKTLRREER